MTLVIGSGNAMNDLEERKEKANAEYQELIQWVVSESKKVSEQLDKEGAVRGLDTNRERFAYIYETSKKRLKEIISKYDLPYEVKW